MRTAERRHRSLSGRNPSYLAATPPFSARARLESPTLWSPETPNLYSAVVTVEGGGGHGC